MFSKATRFEILLEAVPDALVGMDQKGVIRFVNRQTDLLFGYDRHDLIGQPIEMLVPEPLWQIYASHLDEPFADPGNPGTRSRGMDLELSGRHRDGTRFPVNISLSHIDTGDVLLVVTATREMAKRRGAAKRAELIAAVVQYSEDAIIGCTLAGVVTSWNPAAERMYGYWSYEIIDRSARILAPKDRVGEFFDNLARVRDGQVVERLETMGTRKNGTVFPVALTLSPILDEDGVIVGASAIHRDETEQRRAFEVAQRLAAIIQGSDDAILGRTLEGIVTSWNPAAERMYGYTGQEIIGKPIDPLIPEDRVAETDAVLTKVRAGQHVGHYESDRVRKDGSVFPVSITISPIRDADGAIVGASAIHRDITETRRAFEIAQRMKAIVASSEDAIIGQSAEGIIDCWNPAAERMYGYPSQEIVGKPISLLMPEDRREEMEANLARIREGEHVERLKTIRVRKDGTVFPISLTLSPICDPGGAISGASGIGRDLTEQEHAAQYARSLIEASLDPLVTISPEGVIDDVNEATVKITGVPREALIGSDYVQYVTEPDKGREFFQLVFDQGSATDFPLTVRHRDGTLTEVVCNASVYRDLNGNVRGVLATGRDVTEQKRAFVAVQRMAAIIASSADAIIGGDLDRVITSWNPAAERMYGYSSKEMIGRSIEVMIPPDRAREAEVLLAKVKAGQLVENVETLRVRKDGTPIPVSLTFSPIRDADGAIIGSSVIHRNKTEQQHAAQYARSLIEAGLDPMVTISPSGKIDDVNEATVKITGVPRPELLGTDFSHYFTDPDKAHEGYQQAFEKGSLTDYPLTLVHQDGTLTDVLYNASVYRDAHGTVLGVLAAARDASKLREQQQLSEQLQGALESRIVIEQAKGITAQRHGITIDEAYQRMRAHSRNNHASLHAVAEAIVDVGLQI